MADPNRNKKSEESEAEEFIDDQSTNRHEEDNEWLRDQVGEDHNLSGSTTFRTLPDQPEPKKERSESRVDRDRDEDRDR